MDTKKLRQKILDLAIHGKLVPQDPNDEPASVLLERIKAEKERLIKEGKIKRSKKTAKTSDTPHYENVPFKVPEGWEWCKLEDITKIIGDGLHGTPEYDFNGEYFFVNGNNLHKRKILIKEETKRVSILEYEKYRKPLDYTTVLISINGTIGNVAIYNGEKIMLGKSACYINLCQQINKQYICSILESNFFLKYAIESATGSTIKNVPLRAINEFLLPLPPLAEQQRIITEIERWFALIDMIEHDKADLQTIIKQTKSKILDLAIHGKLVPQDPNDEPASELLKRINPKAEITCDNAQYGKRPFEIPNSWCWSRLGDINNIARGGSPRPIKDYLTDDKNGINWIKIGDTTREGKYIDSVKEKIRPEGMKKSRFVHKGDFLLTNSMSFGRPYILNVDGCIHDGWLVISPIGEVYTSDFMYHLLSSSFAFEQFTNVASGGVVTNLNSDKVADTIFPVPPLAEQQRIVAKIEKLFEQLDYIENSLEA